MRTTAADLTARARIRAAVIGLFGTAGFDIGLRAIADEAGVSLGLIRHHFGSEEGPRAACDDQVLREIRLAKEEQFLEGDPGTTMLHNMATVDRYALLMRWLEEMSLPALELYTEACSPTPPSSTPTWTTRRSRHDARDRDLRTHQDLRRGDRARRLRHDRGAR